MSSPRVVPPTSPVTQTKSTDYEYKISLLGGTTVKAGDKDGTGQLEFKVNGRDLIYDDQTDAVAGIPFAVSSPPRGPQSARFGDEHPLTNYSGSTLVTVTARDTDFFSKDDHVATVSTKVSLDPKLFGDSDTRIQEISDGKGNSFQLKIFRAPIKG